MTRFRKFNILRKKIAFQTVEFSERIAHLLCGFGREGLPGSRLYLRDVVVDGITGMNLGKKNVIVSPMNRTAR